MTVLSTQFNMVSRTTVNSVNSHSKTLNKSIENYLLVKELMELAMILLHLVFRQS